MCLLSLTDRFSAGVTDGVTVGHPCCTVHNCKIPLHKQSHRFCPSHAALEDVCCIKGCDKQAGPGFKTCDDSPHRAYELDKGASNKGMRELRRRLRLAGINVPDDSVILDIEPEPVLESTSAPAAATPLPQNVSSMPKVSGRLSRRWTHNEQLYVRCCGVITSRATLYGAEALTGVAVSCFSRLDCDLAVQF